ncbi:MAG: DUF5060 domain-containing protein [Planctomycetota bacterium]|nr:MAG: DUF5060 domain-containing protein [Planctomycetota bacterium]
MRWLAGLIGACAVLATAATGDAAEPQFGKWQKIELSFDGPDARGRGEPNPFAVRLDVRFRSPSGREYVVPGFYNGDDRGGLDGNVWKVRFSADEVGRWTYRTSSDVAQLDGRTGSLVVGGVPADAAGFWKWGRLEAIGTAENRIRYLKFRDGPFWLKAGCDDPENFLGNYRHYDTPDERRAAIDYLAARGINSMYVVLHNVGGDGNDVWPWLGRSPREAKANAAGQVRFDIARLEQWAALFEYMQTQGVALHAVLEDDSAWTGYDHRRYYRELVARFGYLPAMLWNCGEEYNENYSLAEALDLMRQLSRIDPYDHPRGIHNVNRPTDAYIDAPQIDFTSIQTDSPGGRRSTAAALQHNRMAIQWLERCARRRRRMLVVGFDEARPEEDRRCWWSVYLGGGVWETHVREPYDRPPSAWEPAWKQLGGARAFMESMSFWRMQPRNDLVREGQAFCLAAPGEVYAFYLPAGGPVAVQLADGLRYRVAWWNPSNGRDGTFQAEATIGGGVQTLKPPAPGDWAVRLTRSD